MKKDITTKEILKTITEDMAIYIFELKLNRIYGFVDKEFQRIEKREADIVVKCEIDGRDEILHIEIQNSNDPKMPYRMLRYYTDIKTLYPKLPVRQYVVYIGKEKCYIKERIEESNISFGYNLVDMHTIDCEKFLKMDTADSLVVSILCDFKGKDEREIIKYIITRLRELIGDDEYELQKYMVILDTLSTNRELEDIVKEVQDMLRNTRLEDLPTYQLMMERGVAKGIEKGIEKGKLEGKLEMATVMMKEFGLSIKEVAEKFKIPLDELNRYLSKHSS